jgi:hypothetical protein
LEIGSGKFAQTDPLVFPPARCLSFAAFAFRRHDLERHAASGVGRRSAAVGVQRRFSFLVATPRT